MVRYCVERVRGSCGDTSAIALRAYPDNRMPGEGEVEITDEKVARHTAPRTLVVC